jgi:DNA-binding transcriptional MerR regulator
MEPTVSAIKLAEFLGITYQTLNYYASMGLLGEHQQHPGRGRSRAFTFEDAVVARFVGSVIEFTGSIERARTLAKSYQKRLENGFEMKDVYLVLNVQFTQRSREDKHVREKSAHWLCTDKIEDLLRVSTAVTVFSLTKIHEEIEALFSG